MKKKLLPVIILIIAVGAFIFACSLTAPVSDAAGSLWALLPPVIAIGLALVTKEVYSSLLIGIFAGALLSTGFSPLKTMDAAINDGMIEAISGNAGIFAFLVMLGIIVALVNRAGGSVAFGKWAEKHIKTRTGAMLATFALGVIIFIDDYFNCLTVGSVMLPVTDSHRVSRSKLAYIIDATAAPICMIAPISSWAAAVSSYAPEGQGIKLFIKAIPYNFYSVLTIVFVVALCLMKVDFGPMRLHEFNAENHGDLFTSGEKAGEATQAPNSKGKVIDLVLPVAVLIAVCVFALVYNGGILDGKNFIQAFSDTDATAALPWGGLIALLFTMVFLCARKVMSFGQAMECVPQGFKAMVPAILILTFATSLKNMTNALDASSFIENAMSNAASGLSLFLPAIIFIVACLIAFATGTSWGTFGILIPIVLAVFPEAGTIQTIGISACLAGAVCGDHCSPISDTTIMASAGAQCNHINHVNTQLPYAITVAAISFVSYLIAGILLSLEKSAVISIPAGLVLTICTLLVIKVKIKKSENKA